MSVPNTGGVQQLRPVRTALAPLPGRAEAPFTGGSGRASAQPVLLTMRRRVLGRQPGAGRPAHTGA
eukprot:10854731-Alexandrium_andersonii.AAC.1